MSPNRLTLIKRTAACAVAFFAAVSANAGASWSVGISVPGFSVAEPAPVYYEPAPVYLPPPPDYYQPGPPVYYRPPPPVYYRPAPVYSVQPAPGYYWRGERWRHRNHHRDWDERGVRDYSD